MSKHRSLAVLVSLALAPAALAACGGTSDEDSVRKAVQAFVSAGNDKDWEGVCKQFAEEIRKQIEQGQTKCPKVLKDAAGDEITETQADITKVDVSDERATVSAKVKRKGEEAREQELQLVKEDDSWRISSFGE